MHAAPGSLATRHAGAKSDMTTKRVLIVEDEDDIRLLLSEVLGDAGFEVTEAESGDQAIRLLGQGGGRFDLVVTDLSDLSMPGTATAMPWQPGPGRWIRSCR